VTPAMGDDAVIALHMEPSNAIDSLQAVIADRSAQLPGRDLDWLAAHRDRARQRFEALGLPTPRNEAWKYTNVTPIARTAFASVDPTRALGSAHRALPVLGPFRSAPLTQLVFVNGVFTPEHSQLGTLPAGVQVTSTRRVLQNEPEVAEPLLARIVDYEDRAFAALNTALMEDGAFIAVPRSVQVKTPIHLLFFSTAEPTPFAAHPRIVIAAGAASAVTVIEHYVGPPRGTYLNNVVTEMRAGQGAVIDHYKLQQESPEAYHIATTQIDQHRDSNVTSHSIVLGAKISRHEVQSSLNGEGAHCLLNGLYMLDGDRATDHTTFVDHAKPHTTSRQLFKGIMNGRTRGAFTGRVVVRENAQKISADQSNRNLVLSNDAIAESRPQLEIYADDVRCTHGSAIGRLDDDMIFYLRSRGIPVDDARKLLVYAFASEVLRNFKVRQFRSHLEEIFATWLPAGRLLGEAT